MELYNFQQQLAKMQMQLEKAQENYSHISQIRVQAEEQLQKLQQTHAEEEQLTAQERLKVRYLLVLMCSTSRHVVGNAHILLGTYCNLSLLQCYLARSCSVT